MNLMTTPKYVMTVHPAVGGRIPKGSMERSDSFSTKYTGFTTEGGSRRLGPEGLNPVYFVGNVVTCYNPAEGRRPRRGHGA